MTKVRELAPFVQGEALVLSKGSCTFSVYRTDRSATGEVWCLYDETRWPNGEAGTISVVYGGTSVLDVGMTGEENPVMEHASITVTVAAAVVEADIRAYVRRLLDILNIRGEVRLYVAARDLGLLRQ